MCLRLPQLSVWRQSPEDGQGGHLNRALWYQWIEEMEIKVQECRGGWNSVGRILQGRDPTRKRAPGTCVGSLCVFAKCWATHVWRVNPQSWAKNDQGTEKLNYFQGSHRAGRCSSSKESVWRVLGGHWTHSVETPEKFCLNGLKLPWNEGYSRPNLVKLE